MPTFRIVLVHSRNSLNMGAAARAMANFGLDDLVLVAPYEEAWRTVREATPPSARAGAAVLERARAVTTLTEALSDCDYVVGTTDGSSRSPEVRLEPWPAVAASLDSLPSASRIALVFGSEKFGLSVDDISFCDRLARLPTQPEAPSMNLGQAVAVCAYELYRTRQERQGAQAEPTPLSARPAGGILPIAGRERLTGLWYPLLEQLGVVQPEHRAREMRVLREMLTRWQLTPKDEHRLLGLARQLRHVLTGQVRPRA